ncbi:hypothetical protein [Bacteroides intestinalis]|jgi:acetyltransferase-like isoleucine patch superfamily enzyme|nr:hypothetical protein [Bacteroides intestinalis]
MRTVLIGIKEDRKELNIKTSITQGRLFIDPIIIEDDAFIGTRTIITKGVTIGTRSIIVVGSVVVCDVPPDEIWGGNPANFIKKCKMKQ